MLFRSAHTRPCIVWEPAAEDKERTRRCRRCRGLNVSWSTRRILYTAGRVRTGIPSWVRERKQDAKELPHGAPPFVAVAVRLGEQLFELRRGVCRLSNQLPYIPARAYCAPVDWVQLERRCSELGRQANGGRERTLPAV